MVDYQQFPDFRQVLVLGRGIEQDGSIKFDSAISGDSYDRGETAGLYAANHAAG
jgi:hypothetical protein